MHVLPVSTVPEPAEVARLVAALLGSGGEVVLPVPAGDPTTTRRVLDAARAAAPDDAVAAVATSGSTGPPRLVLLTRACLRASADAAVERIGGPGGWTLALGVTHVAGLQVVLRAALAEEPLVVCPPGGAGWVEAFAAATARLTGARRYTSLVPTQLRRLLDAGAADALRRYDAVLVGGAPADARLLADARAEEVQVVTTYGMSETSGGCVYDGRPLDGVGVELVEGRVVLTGPTVALGYLGGPPFSGRFATADAGRLVDGRLEVLGRLDDLVVTGGEKVAPARVEAALLGLDGVAEAAVVGVPDREWGQALAAVVVGSLDPADVRRRMTAVLAAHEVPKRVLRVDALPRIGIGKVDYAAVRALLAD